MLKSPEHPGFFIGGAMGQAMVSTMLPLALSATASPASAGLLCRIVAQLPFRLEPALPAAPSVCDTIC